MRIIADTREQTPYRFEGKPYAEVSVEQGTLPTGDYSLSGLEGKVGVERKSLPDLMACMGKERERFMAEMERARGFEAFAVVVGCAWRDIASGNYRSQVSPQVAIATLSAIMARHGIPVIFCRKSSWRGICDLLLSKAICQGA